MTETMANTGMTGQVVYAYFASPPRPPRCTVMAMSTVRLNANSARFRRMSAALLDFIASSPVEWFVLYDQRAQKCATLSPDEAYMLACFVAAGMPVRTIDDLFVKAPADA